MVDNYDVPTTAEENSQLRDINNTVIVHVADSKELERNATESITTSKVDTADSFTTFINGAFGAARLVATAPISWPVIAYKLITGMVSNAGIPIPTVILVMILSILSITAVFAVISGIFKWAT